MSTIPQEWRLFWAIQSIGISFALALIAVAYYGDASPLLSESTVLINGMFPSFYLWGVSPVAVTWGSFRLSSALQTICEFIEASEYADVHMSTAGFVLSRVLVGFLAILKDARSGLREEPCFFVVKSAWLAQAVGSWIYLGGVFGYPIAFNPPGYTATSYMLSLGISGDILTLVVLNLVLVIGLVAKAIELLVRRPERVTITMEQLHSSKRDPSVERRSNRICSRVPSFLAGWGIGYWITSLLFVLGASWDRDVWVNAPFIVILIGYVVLPSFLLVGVFMLADPNILGSRLGIYIKRGVDILRSKQSVVYWSLATVLRDVVMLWVIISLYLRYSLYSGNNGA